MSSVPEKFSLERQDELDMRAKLKTSKARWSFKGECMRFDCVNREVDCDNCIRYSEYKSA